MNIYMQIIGEMEAALEKCADNSDPLGGWDRAAAYYVGSLDLPGNLLYSLANKRCQNFKTCGENGDQTSGEAKASMAIMDLFTEGQAHLQAKRCGSAKAAKERIAQLMAIPMIQGSLRYNYISAYELSAGEKIEAEGLVFAAAVLPLVHACSPDDAATIYENVKIDRDGDDFPALKMAFENNYECMKLTCKDIGGKLFESTDRR